MSTFYFGGKRADELGLVMLRQSQRPVLPGTVERTMQIPGRHGAWDFGADLGPRLFNLEVAFVERNAAELQRRVSELAAFLVDSYGRPITRELKFSVQPDRVFYARYSGSLPIERVAGLGRFTLPLITHDPFAYSAEERLYETVITESPYAQVIESVGTIRTSSVIILTNEGTETITGFKITNEYRLE
jgi:predicted phage tail component-like protein